MEEARRFASEMRLWEGQSHARVRYSLWMAYTEPDPKNSGTRLGIGGWLIIVALIAMLGASFAYAIHTWNAMEGTSVSPLGWLFMGLGVVVTTVVGAGLMALVFYSSRQNYDR